MWQWTAPAARTQRSKQAPVAPCMATAAASSESARAIAFCTFLPEVPMALQLQHSSNSHPTRPFVGHSYDLSEGST